MSNDTFKKVNEILKAFNDTFEIEANIVQDGKDVFVEGFKIIDIKKDCDSTAFVNTFYDIFGNIISSISDEHEIIYDKEKGLVIAKKITKQIVQTKYKIEEFE